MSYHFVPIFTEVVAYPGQVYKKEPRDLRQSLVEINDGIQQKNMLKGISFLQALLDPLFIRPCY